MGFKISWLAFSGKSKTDVLASLHVIDTGIHDEGLENPMTVASFPNDWTIVFLNRFDHPFAEDASLRLLSKDCAVIAGHVHEGIMFSSIEFYRDGVPIWSAFHNSDEGMYHLETEGSLPEVFAEIKAQLVSKQNQDGGENGVVDHIIDIPLHTAKALCGFEHSRWKYKWGEPHFTALRDRSELQ